MGCSSSSMDLYEPKSFKDKTLVWLLGGGPGAPKQEVARFLVQRYKFRLLSAVQMIRFEESTESPEAAEIKKCIEMKQQFPSDLFMRILKRIWSLHGPRKYLIEGFPRNEADVVALTAVCAQYERVELMGYINIDLTEEQMKQSGVKALKERKKEESEENIQKEVRQYIESYRTKIKSVHDHYQSCTNFINQPYLNNDVYQVNMKIEEALTKQDVKPVRNVPIHFLLGNDSKQLKAFALKLSKRFGMLTWGLEELISEAKNNTQFKKEAEKPLEEVKDEFLVGLINRKVEKSNYKGPYLFWGYPRKEEDLRALRMVFLQEATFATFSCCVHTPTTQNQQALYEKLQKYFSQFEKTPSLIVKAGETAYTQIQSHIAKVQTSFDRASGCLVVVPVLEDQGCNSPLAKMPECDFVEFKDLMKKQIAEKHLYSELINSCETLGRPLPPPLASSIVFRAIANYDQKNKKNNNQNGKPLVVRGYPQNLQQLKVLYSRSTQLKALGAFIFDYSSAKVKQAKLAEHKEMENCLGCGCDSLHKFSDKTASEECKGALAKLQAL